MSNFEHESIGGGMLFRNFRSRGYLTATIESVPEMLSRVRPKTIKRRTCLAVIYAQAESLFFHTRSRTARNSTSYIGVLV